MRAVTFRDKGELLIAEHDDPVPGKGELLVRVRGAGLNAGDLLQRRGFYPAPPGVPADIPGLELAGEVEAVGPGVTGAEPGGRVMAIVAGGGQSELALVHERHAIEVPDSLVWAQAGAAPEAFMTAWDALFAQAQLKSGERLLVHGGAGGVGVAAIQLGRIAGARVSATVRNEQMRQQVGELGATVLAPGDFAGAGPFDVILELIGASNMSANVGALATGGRICVIGVGAGGVKAELNLLALMTVRGRIHGSTLRARPLEDKAIAARGFEQQVLPHLASGEAIVPVEAEFALAEAEAAYERFGAGSKFGKIVLIP